MKSPRPFIVFALPRSRTAWLANYLSYFPRRCGHDSVVNCASVADFLSVFERGLSGTVETGAMLGWRLIRHRMPEARLVVIRREVPEVLHSLSKLGVVGLHEEMYKRAALLDALSLQPGVKTFAFHDLDRREVAKWLFENLLELPFDDEWWLSLASYNIQIDFWARVAQIEANRSRLIALQAEIEFDTAALSSAKHGMECRLN